jgi:hypothetical protein
MELVDNLDLYERGSYHKKVIAPLMEEFGISERIVYKRIKSYAGKTVSELIYERRMPSKEEMDRALILTDTSQQFFEMLNIDKSQRIKIGLFDKHYGASTYTAAKTKLYQKIPNLEYNPTIEDNKTIIISQVLGDGYLDVRRKAVKIEHSIHQFDYLRLKVSLFNRAFPTTAGLENIKRRDKDVRGDTYPYCAWYSRKLPAKYVEQIAAIPRHELVKEMTPLGWMLLYLDDGSLYHYRAGDARRLALAFSKHHPELGKAYIEELKTYGFNFKFRENSVCLSSLTEITEFLHCFIWPYKHLIPSCMYYKLDLKI